MPMAGWPERTGSRTWSLGARSGRMFGGFVLMRMPIVDGWAEGKGSGIEVSGCAA